MGRTSLRVSSLGPWACFTSHIPHHRLAPCSSPSSLLFTTPKTAQRAGVEASRKAFAELLRREVARTFSVDSITVSIASDNVCASEAILHSRYWLARSVRFGKGPITRQIGWVDNREEWQKIGARGCLTRSTKSMNSPGISGPMSPARTSSRAAQE